ncbi:RHS repeat-associated core domain-containing protein [Candidatus Nitrospira bockiana]
MSHVGIQQPGGTASTSAFQYAGRENDGTGLYYYRARYYSPRLQRFISEDPLDCGSGNVNLYSYIRNSPMSLVQGPTPHDCEPPLDKREKSFQRLGRQLVCALNLLPGMGGVNIGFKGVPESIRIAEEALKHIAERHFLGGIRAAGKSLFNNGER